MKEKIIYKEISIKDKAMFINVLDMPRGVSNKVEYDGEYATVVFYNIEERLVKRIKRDLKRIKLFHYSNKVARNTGVIGASIVRGTAKGASKFAGEVKKELNHVKEIIQ